MARTLEARLRRPSSRRARLGRRRRQRRAGARRGAHCCPGSRAAPGTRRSSRPAGRRCGLRASRSSRCRRCRAPELGRDGPTRRAPTTRSACSWIAQRGSVLGTTRGRGWEAVAEICRRLDGLPLGIEIAASRIALLPARDIADRLGRRLDLPGSGSREAPERQRTLQAAIGWSNDLLREPERRLLERLSVFAGGFGVPRRRRLRPSRGARRRGPGRALGAGRPQPRAARRRSSAARFRLLTTVRMFAADRLDAARGDREHPSPARMQAYLAIAGRRAVLPGPGQACRLDRSRWSMTTSGPRSTGRSAMARWNRQRLAPRHGGMAGKGPYRGRRRPSRASSRWPAPMRGRWRGSACSRLRRHCLVDGRVRAADGSTGTGRRRPAVREPHAMAHALFNRSHSVARGRPGG